MQVVISVLLPIPSGQTKDKQTNKPTGSQNTKHPNCQAFAPCGYDALLIKQGATITVFSVVS
jgi:hypothetical protein